MTVSALQNSLTLAERMFPDALFRLPAMSDDRFIVLTIDDAPSRRSNEITAILKSHGAGATFFAHSDHITSDVTRDALNRIGREEHDIAHHMPQDGLTALMARERFTEEFIRAERILSPLVGFQHYFRPARGFYRNNIMAQTLRQRGYTIPGTNCLYVMASFLPWDAGPATNTPLARLNLTLGKTYAQTLAKKIFPGAIVVFHDGETGGRKARLATTLSSLDLFLEKVRGAGYDVLSLTHALSRVRITKKEHEGPQA